MNGRHLDGGGGARAGAGACASAAHPAPFRPDYGNGVTASRPGLGVLHTGLSLPIVDRRCAFLSLYSDRTQAAVIAFRHGLVD